jgi:hypothetical protein
MDAATSGPQAIKQTPYINNRLRNPFYFNRPERDDRSGVSKILIFDSCRDNPFKMSVATK